MDSLSRAKKAVIVKRWGWATVEVRLLEVDRSVRDGIAMAGTAQKTKQQVAMREKVEERRNGTTDGMRT